jgi:hypothetical protein
MKMDDLQRHATELQMAVLREIKGYDAEAAREWADDVVEESFAEVPGPSRLRVYLNEIEKKVPYSARELCEQIDAIRSLIA